MITNEKGTLTTYTGDSYQVTFDIKGLEPVCLYQIYFQINYNSGGTLVKKSEITTDDMGNCKVRFDISVEENQKSGRFAYGLKACRDCQEDTIKTGYIQVNSLAVEGTNDEQLCNG